MKGNVSLDEFARAVDDASPDLDGEGKRIAVESYRLLAKGEPVSTAQIAEAAKVDPESVEETLRSWPLVFWDDQDRVVGFWGLTVYPLEPTHAMNVGGSTVYGWCAWDTLFVPEILGTEVWVESTDPHDGTSIRLTVTPEGVTDLNPSDAVVSLLLPEDGFTDDAIARFCHKIHFFSSSESADDWIGDRSGVFSISVDEAFELGRLTNRLRMGTIDRAGSGG